MDLYLVRCVEVENHTLYILSYPLCNWEGEVVYCASSRYIAHVQKQSLTLVCQSRKESAGNLDKTCYLR